MLKALEHHVVGDIVLLAIGLGVVCAVVWAVVNTTRYPKNRGWFSFLVAVGLVLLLPAFFAGCGPNEQPCVGTAFDRDIPRWLWWEHRSPTLYLIALAEFWLVSYVVLWLLNLILAPWLKTRQVT